MRPIRNWRWVIGFLIVPIMIIMLGLASNVRATIKNYTPSLAGSKTTRAASPGGGKSAPGRSAGSCSQCDGEKAARVAKTSKKSSRLAGKTSCHPKGYVDPKVARKYNAAMKDLKRAGIKPQITSTWRSSQQQARLHKCSRSSRCRRAHPGLYYALPPGQSLHEAGFAVDLSGVAAGPRGNKRLTSQGRRIVKIMEKNGFNWRYGLADPAHFEANPRNYGYRSVKQAISKNQTQCTVKGIARNKAKPTSRTGSVRASTKTSAQRQVSTAGTTKSRLKRG